MEVYKEAHLLALQIESNSKNKAARAARPEDPWSQGVERFIQESKLKVNLFEKENEMKKSPKSLKRETYYLSDSPLMGPLPLGTQPPSGVGLQGSPAQASLTRPQGPPLSSCPLPVEPSAAHLPSQAVTQKKVISKLQPPRASSVRGKSIHLAMEKVDKTLSRIFTRGRRRRPLLAFSVWPCSGNLYDEELGDAAALGGSVGEG